MSTHITHAVSSTYTYAYTQAQVQAHAHRHTYAHAHAHVRLTNYTWVHDFKHAGRQAAPQ